MNIIQDPASQSNYSFGRFGARVDLGLLHTEDGFETGTDAWFANAAAHVSTQYSIGLDGTIRMHVSEGDTAYGAGNWIYNTRSIQIEFEDNKNPNGVVRTEAQLASGAWLIADVSRRNGFPCDRAHWLKHGEVPGTDHRECPGNLPVDDLVARAQAILGGATPPVVEPAAASVSGVNPFGPGKIRVLVDVLRVHGEPNTTSAGNLGNVNADGMLHIEDTFDINGWVRGQLVSQGGKTSDVWLHTTLGHYVWAADTDFFQAAPNVSMVATPAAPAPAPAAPSYDFNAEPGIVTVMPEIGANLRSKPSTHENDIDHAVEQNTAHTVVGFVSNGDAVGGNTKWWKTDDNLYLSDAVVSFAAAVVPAPPAPTPPAPTPPAAPEVPAAAPIVPAAPAVDPMAFKETFTAHPDILYVTADAVIHDFDGKLGDVAVKPGQIVREAGTFQVDGVTYIQSRKSADAGNWYGYPLNVLTAIPPTGRTLTDIRPPKALQELEIEATQAAIGTVASAVSLGEKLSKLFAFNHKKK